MSDTSSEALWSATATRLETRIDRLTGRLTMGAKAIPSTDRLEDRQAHQ